MGVNRRPYSPAAKQLFIGVEHAWESTQSFTAVSATRGAAYSESGSYHSGTLGEIEKFKMLPKWLPLM